MDQWIVDRTEGDYKEVYDALDAVSCIIRGTVKLPLPVLDTVATQHAKCKEVADVAWTLWQQSQRSEPDTQEPCKTLDSSQLGVTNFLSSSQSDPLANSWLRDWADGLEEAIQHALDSGASFASQLWMPAGAAKWAMGQTERMSQLTTLAANRIAELISFFELHARHDVHPVLAELRGLQVGEYIPEHSLNAWQARFGLHQVAQLGLNFLSNEVEHSGWRVQLAQQLIALEEAALPNDSRDDFPHYGHLR